VLSYGVPARGNVRTRRLCSCCSAFRAFCRYASVFVDTSTDGPLSTSSGRRSSCEPNPARAKRSSTRVRPVSRGCTTAGVLEGLEARQRADEAAGLRV
jgi:hypothetical protein